jgi:hypothetical protein
MLFLLPHPERGLTVVFDLVITGIIMYKNNENDKSNGHSEIKEDILQF